MFKKILLIFFGLIISLAVFELFLQSVSVFVKYYKNYSINRKLSEKDSITILCLGESTTDGQWPKFLKKALSKHNITKKVTVIDKGVRATNTACIINNIELEIKEIKPDIIVAMMGINDGNSDVIGLKKRYFKLQKLFFLIKQHLNNRKSINDKNNDGFQTDFNFANKLFDIQQYDESINIFESLLNKNNGNNIKITKILTRAYVIKAKKAGFETEEAKKYLKRAEQLVLEAIKKDPYYDINAILFILAQNKNRLMIEKLFPVTDKTFFKQIYEQDPWAFISHTHLFVELEMNDFVKSIAEQLYSAEITEKTPYADRILGSNATLLIESKNYKTADKYLNMSKNYLMKNIPEMTAENYCRLAEICREKKIKLVAMQYPVRPVEQLQIVLENYSEVYFVNNEKIFKEAFKTQKISDIFKDLFAGDFGHCTDLGNKMIANNLAETIKKLIN
ncbi:MAG: hypothetical protein PHI20_06600 [Endomicrobiaceae bacterium]|jgi:lysophospholipase L1-like esterase|nr:hypothetical protein [Endomicrobiaceae bacterium]MDD4165560.1 hypothetical protein [Endomicrobiaceae bacterium]